MWEPQWHKLTSQRDSVRLDLRGFGDSKTAPVGSVDHAADVLETAGGFDRLVAGARTTLQPSFALAMGVPTF